MTVPALLVGLVAGSVGAVFLAVVVHFLRLYRAGFAQDPAGAMKRDVFTALFTGKGLAPIPLAFVLGFLGVTLLVFGAALVWDSLATFWAHGIWLGYVL